MSMQGKVKFFSEQQGYGFIKPNGGGPDVFVHRNEICGQALREGDNVSYTFVIDERSGKHRAQEVSGGTGGMVPEGGNKGREDKGKGKRGNKGKNPNYGGCCGSLTTGYGAMGACPMGACGMAAPFGGNPYGPAFGAPTPYPSYGFPGAGFAAPPAYAGPCQGFNYPTFVPSTPQTGSFRGNADGKRPACRQWKNGNCTYGEKCRFEHE